VGKPTEFAASRRRLLATIVSGQLCKAAVTLLQELDCQRGTISPCEEVIHALCSVVRASC